MDTKKLTEYIESYKSYLHTNYELFDIYEGNLKGYVDNILRSTLTSAYYSKMKDRIYPINILKRIIDKLAKVYGRKPLRTASSNQQVLEVYEKLFNIDSQFNIADEFTNLFKGYAMEPYLDTEGNPALRVLPFDRFLVESESIVDPTQVTRFYKHIGKIQKKGKEIDAWLVYTDETFVAIDADGDIIDKFMKDDQGNLLDGTNPLGFIPFFYSGMSNYKVIPTQDTDTLALAKLLPTQISDLSGVSLFQCFTIIYGIDVDAENLVMSPNAFWNFKSDPKSDKAPLIDTVKPSADIEKVLMFIRETFKMWLESRGIKATGSTANRFGGVSDAASGISKIIDEMDTSEIVKKGIEKFKKDEYHFWKMIAKIHNHWVDKGVMSRYPKLPEDWTVTVQFDEPKPLVNRNDEVETIIKERDGGIISTRTAIEKLYPDWKKERIEEEIRQIEKEKGLSIWDGNGSMLNSERELNQLKGKQ